MPSGLTMPRQLHTLHVDCFIGWKSWALSLLHRLSWLLMTSSHLSSFPRPHLDHQITPQRCA